VAVTLRASADDKGVKLALGRMGKAIDPRLIADKAADVMVHTWLPHVWRTNAYGWPQSSWRPGAPLRDTSNHLLKGFVYSVTTAPGNNATAEIKNLMFWAWVHDKGATLKPKKQFLAVPLSPPLGINEARTAKTSDYPGAFVLIKGPEGPGIYRKSKTATSVDLKNRKTKYAKGKSIERIFALLKQVTIKQRRFMFWPPEAKKLIMERVKTTVVRMAKEGKA
jgi:phage gpG-like protein